MSEVATFVRKRRFEWVEYPTEPIVGEDGEPIWEPDPDFAGFRARVYANVTMEEVRHEFKLWEQMTATPPELEEYDYLRELGWRIAAWNFTAETEDGEVAPVPPPAEDPRSMYLLSPNAFWWVIRQMRTSHFPKAQSPEPPIPLRSAGTTATSTRTKTTPAAKRRAS